MSMIKHRRLKLSYMLGATVLSGTITVGALRHNYETMNKLRSKVFMADEQNGDVEGALQDLRSYVGSHMNTNLSGGDNSIYPPIQLKYRYDRLVAAQKDRADINKVYSDAQAACAQQGDNRVNCVDQYVAANGPASAQVVIPEGLYKFDFASPTWSPDVAGWGIVVTILLATATLGLAIKRKFHRKK